MPLRIQLVRGIQLIMKNFFLAGLIFFAFPSFAFAYIATPSTFEDGATVITITVQADLGVQAATWWSFSGSPSSDGVYVGTYGDGVFPVSDLGYPGGGDVGVSGMFFRATDIDCSSLTYDECNNLGTVSSIYVGAPPDPPEVSTTTMSADATGYFFPFLFLFFIAIFGFFYFLTREATK